MLADLIITKYTSGIEGLEDSLKTHTDASMISFNLSLSEYGDGVDGDSSGDYSGGGTWVPLLNDSILIRQCDLLVHDSGIIHGGAKIRSGTRYLIAGFVNLKFYKNPTLYWYRHFGTTATCVKVRTVTNKRSEVDSDNNNEEEEIVCSKIGTVGYETFVSNIISRAPSIWAWIRTIR